MAAPTIIFVQKQDYIGVFYEPGDTARVPHEIPKFMADYWIKLKIARLLTEEDVRKESRRAAAAEAAEREDREEALATARADKEKAKAKAELDRASAAFAKTVNAPASKGKRKK